MKNRIKIKSVEISKFSGFLLNIVISPGFFEKWFLRIKPLNLKIEGNPGKWYVYPHAFPVSKVMSVAIDYHFKMEEFKN